MSGQIGIGEIDRRLVEAGPGDTGLEIIGDDLCRDTAEEVESALVRSTPVRQ